MMRHFAHIRQDRHHVERNRGWGGNISIAGYTSRWCMYRYTDDTDINTHYTDDTCIGTQMIQILVYTWWYRYQYTDDTHIGTIQIFCILREQFVNINMRHFLGSLHQVFLVTRVFIFKEELYINHWYGYGRDLLDSMWHNMPHIWWLYRGNFKWALGNYNSLKAVLHAKEEEKIKFPTVHCSLSDKHTHTHRSAYPYPSACSTLGWVGQAQRPGSRDGT